MKFGMPTLIETNTLEECAALCRKLGLDFIELSMSLPQYTLDAINIQHFKEIANRYGLLYTIHLDENVNFGDFNSYIANACCQYVADTIRLAKELESPVINMHLHDAVGKKNHLALGTGEIDIDKYLTLAKERDCRVVLETKTIAGLRESVEWVHRRY